MTTAVIVQARMGSSRLPGKVMMSLAGKPVLEHVLSRCKEISRADVVVCAVPDEPDSDVMLPVIEMCGAFVFRGSEQDVLARYYEAAKFAQARVILRVTADCPLIDPDVCDALLWLRQSKKADYASNVDPRTFPKGLDCEAFTMAALTEAHNKATDAYDREHVTPWLQRAPHLRRANLSNPKDESARRWTLDTKDDLAHLRRLVFTLNRHHRMADVLEAEDSAVLRTP